MNKDVESLGAQVDQTSDAKSKGLRWGTEYTYFPQGPIISFPGQCGVKDFGG